MTPLTGGIRGRHGRSVTKAAMRWGGPAVVGLVAAGLSALSAFAVISASRTAVVGGAADAECISCHIDTFNRGISAPFPHPPFFERQCGICHLPESTGVAPSAVATPPARTTGTVVAQEPAWAKRTVVGSTVPAIPQTDHTVVLRDLLANGQYRFRIALSETGNVPDEATSYSLWMGLDPQEVAASSGGGFEVDRAGMVAVASDVGGPVTVRIAGVGELSVHWETATPLFAWVEVERIEPVTAPAAAEASHPVMREAEEVAIDLCYSCHPTNAIGTSHPVRVYAAGNEIRIPDDLPTVRDGMITCVTCHDPHGAEGKNLVRETIKTKLCVACHYRFRGTSTATMF